MHVRLSLCCFFMVYLYCSPAIKEPVNEVGFYTYVIASLCVVALAVAAVLTAFTIKNLCRRHRMKKHLRGVFQVCAVAITNCMAEQRKKAVGYRNYTGKNFMYAMEHLDSSLNEDLKFSLTAGSWL